MRKALEKIAAKYNEVKQKLAEISKLAEAQNLIIGEIQNGVLEAEDADARLIRLMKGDFDQLKLASEVELHVSEATISTSSNSFSAEDSFVSEILG